MQNDIQEKAVYNYPLNDNIYNEKPEAEATRAGFGRGALVKFRLQPAMRHFIRDAAGNKSKRRLHLTTCRLRSSADIAVQRLGRTVLPTKCLRISR